MSSLFIQAEEERLKHENKDLMGQLSQEQSRNSGIDQVKYVQVHITFTIK